MLRILLVEDHPMLFEAYEAAVGKQNLTWCATVPQLRRLIELGQRWDLAFIDFELGAEPNLAGTGFGALLELRKLTPCPRLVVSSNLTDGGRELFALAAYQWFGVRAVVDKRDATKSLITSVVSGADPTAPARREKFHTSGFLINTLFQEPSWSRIWGVWFDANGSIPVARKLLNNSVTDYQLRTFQKQALDAVENLRAAFFTQEQAITPEGRQYNFTAPLIGFVHRNQPFFGAPELDRALAVGKPWDR